MAARFFWVFFFCFDDEQAVPRWRTEETLNVNMQRMGLYVETVTLDHANAPTIFIECVA